MKRTVSQNIANPRRTTLAHLQDAASLQRVQAEHSTELPAVTANPRRTVLMVKPAPAAQAV